MEYYNYIRQIDSFIPNHYIDIPPGYEMASSRQNGLTKNVRIQTALTAADLNNETTHFREHTKSKNIRVQTMLTAAELNDQSDDFRQYSRNNGLSVSSNTVSHQMDQQNQTTEAIDSEPFDDINLSLNQQILDTNNDNIKKENVLENNHVHDESEFINPIEGYADEPLLSLVDACEPLTDVLHNLSFYVELALNETPREPPDRLSVDESAAIRLYTIEWDKPHRSLYSMVNYHLKNIDREKLLPYFRYLKLFITALVKLPCVPPLTVWRGVTKNLSDDFPPGTRVTWWAFSSTTSEMTVLENNMYLGSEGDRTLFSVEAINGRTIKAHSHFVTEDEILLLPGTHMIVQSQLSPAAQLHIIHLKQVKPEEKLLELPFPGAHVYPKTHLLTTLIIVGVVVGVIFGTKSNLKRTTLRCTSLFGAANEFSTQHTPTSVVVGYFRNSSQADVIVSSSKDNNVGVLLNNGNGILKVIIGETDTNPVAMASGDFNNDTYVDLVVVDRGANTVRMLLNDGQGALNILNDYDVGDTPIFIKAADFNYDKILDVLVINQYDTFARILFGKGDGTFSSMKNLDIDLVASSVVVADFNKDNILDLAFSNINDNCISVLIGSTNGSFQDTVKYNVGYSPSLLITGDFDSDTIVDLAIAGQGDSSVYILFGQGDGVFHNLIQTSTIYYPSCFEL
ncbi:unnamed protein product [Adineta ricciae]|uniref:NAD(P)(+)--arginine ADP-ribosyltransferase n=1 Tax=Adineta ricciae TaxID=249248 RepID=A0A815PPB6_ADIRI|nr:unnamed protein product [Adineta ricciae]